MKRFPVLVFLVFLLLGGSAHGESDAGGGGTAGKSAPDGGGTTGESAPEGGWTHGRTRCRLGGWTGLVSRGGDLDDPDSTRFDSSQWGISLGIIPMPNLEWGVEVSQVELSWDDRIGSIAEMSEILYSPFVLIVLPTGGIRFHLGGGLEAGTRKNRVMDTTVESDLSGNFWTAGFRLPLDADSRVSLDLSLKTARGKASLPLGESRYDRVEVLLGVSSYL